MMGADAVLMIAVFGLALGCWVLYQNQRTYADRTWLIYVIFRQVDWDKQRECLDAVTYDKHLLYRCLLLDWRKLYPKNIQDLLV